LNTPPKMDNDTTISNLQSPTLPRWGSFLWDGPTQCEEDMSTAYPNLIAYTAELEAELNCTIRNTWLWGEIDMPLQYSTTLTTYMTSNTCGIFVFHFIFCFVKVLRWWGVARSTQPQAPVTS
jgi:hypothetical protein